MSDISFALIIDVQVTLLSKVDDWEFKGLFGVLLVDNAEEQRKSHDEVYGCLKGGSGNSGGKRLAISMVEEAWLSENKRCDQKKKSVFVEEK
ncbi:hypothetical protein Tco_0890150 [Tanacetum coccineum]